MIRGSVLISRQRLLTGLAVALIVGVLMAGSLARAVASPTGPAQSTIRVGTVVASPAPTGDVVWVQLDDDGDAHDLPYLSSYIPVAGDEVMVLFLSAPGAMQGLVLGGRSGQAGNLVVNGSMARHPTPTVTGATPPYGWQISNVSGNTAVHGTILSSVYQRPVMMVASTSGSAADNVAYSAAFAIAPEETIAVDVVFQASTVPASVTVTAKIAWLAGADDQWDQALSTTTIASDNDTVPFGSALSGSATAPTSAAYARVGVEVGFVGAGSGYTVLISEVDAHR